MTRNARFGTGGEVVLRTIAMPAEANANGHVFGGWLLGQMDIGAAILARGITHGRVTTVAVDKVSFSRPVHVGDVVTCLAQLERLGRTSMRIKIDAWVQRYATSRRLKVADGIFTYVAIDAKGQPRPVKRRAAT